MEKSVSLDNSKKIHNNFGKKHRADRNRKKSEFSKDKPSGFKGKHHTQKTKKLLSDLNKGKTLSEETKNKISKAGLGRKHTEETKKKISDSKKGEKHSEEHTKNNIEANLGRKASFETKNKMSESRKGKIQSLETRKRNSESHKGKKLSEATKNKISKTKNMPEAKQKQLEHLKKQAKSGTKIELQLQLILKELGYVYDVQHIISHIAIADIFVEPNYVFFADGDYWHNKPKVFERDIRQNKELLNKGYIVLRFWGHEIENESEKIKEKIKEILGNHNLFK